MIAAYYGFVDIARFLKDQGVDLSLEDKDGDTALDLAEARNQQEVIKILRENRISNSYQDRFKIKDLPIKSDDVSKFLPKD